MSKAFLDSNMLVYAFSTDERKPVALNVLRIGGAISVQCLNEFAHVARRKLGLDWDDVHDALAVIRERCAPVLPVDTAVHESGLALAQRHRLSVYDGMIVAAALAAGCDILWSEDMQDGLVVDGRLRVVNPFRPD